MPEASCSCHAVISASDKRARSDDHVDLGVPERIADPSGLLDAGRGQRLMGDDDVAWPLLGCADKARKGAARITQRRVLVRGQPNPGPGC